MSTREEFAVAVLSGIGADTSAANVEAMLAWMAGENTRAENNPLATTQGTNDPGRYGNPSVFNSHGVKNYPDFDTGVRATIDTLNLSYYTDVVAALNRGTTAAELEGLVAESPWGTKTFGVPDGSVTVPGGRAPSTIINPGMEARSGYSTQPVTDVPAGAASFNVDGQGFLAYTVDGGRGATATVFFHHPGPVEGPNITAAEWESRSADWVDAGSTGVFVDDPDMAGRTWADIVDGFLYETGHYGSDSLSDPEVVRVIAEYMARPDMSPEELELRLAGTTWWGDRTERQLVWNDLSDAERQQRLLDEAQKLGSLMEQYTGVPVDWAAMDLAGDGIDWGDVQAADADLAEWAAKIASGASTQITAVNDWVKPTAAGIEQSPHNRRLEAEVIAAGQRGVNVAANRGTIVDLYHRFGLDVSEEEASRLAEEVYLNETSIEDVEDSIKDQSVSVWTNKPRDVDWATWTSPYRQAYAATLETALPDFRDPTMVEQLGAVDMPNLADFKRSLRGQERWQYTQNARDAYQSTFSAVGRTMGFQ